MMAASTVDTASMTVWAVGPGVHESEDERVGIGGGVDALAFGRPADEGGRAVEVRGGKELAHRPVELAEMPLRQGDAPGDQGLVGADLEDPDVGVVDENNWMNSAFYTNNGYLERIVLPETQDADGDGVPENYDRREIRFEYEQVNWGGGGESFNDNRGQVQTLTRITDADGQVTPPLYGITLDGSEPGTAVIPDTDDGLLAVPGRWPQ